MFVSDTIRRVRYWDFPRGTAGARGLVAAGAEFGLSAERCLHGTGLDEHRLAQPQTAVQAGHELQIMRNLVTALGEETAGVGAAAGCRFTLGSFGIWGFALLTSPTVGDAITLAVQYVQLTYAFVRVGIEQPRPRQVVVTFDDTEIPSDVRAIACERDFTGMGWLLRTVLPGVRVPFETALRGAHAQAVADAAPQLRVRPGDTNRLLLDAGLLAHPMPQADPQAWHDARQECAGLLERRQVRHGVAGEVRARLLEQPDRMPSLQEIADDLHVDPRTLRRQLLSERTSYRDLRTEVITTLAAELLSHRHLTVEQVARALGYADAASFTHAYSRWTGAPPRRPARAT